MSMIMVLSAGRLCVIGDEGARATCTIHVPVEEQSIVSAVNEGDLHLGRAHIVVGEWHNKENRFDGRPVVVTVDFGRVCAVDNVRLAGRLRPWHAIGRAEIALAVEQDNYEVPATGDGPEPSRTQHTRFELDVGCNRRPARYVRVTVFPKAFWRLNPGTLEIELAPGREVTEGVERLADDLAFYEPDGPIEERWADEGVWAEQWRNFSPGVPRVGGPGAYVKAYFHNRTRSPLEVRGLKLNGVLIDEHMHVAEDGRGASLWINPDQESTDFQTLIAAGDPVWYKTEPERVPSGGIAEMTLRLRTQPADPLTLTLVTGAGELAVTTRPARPALDVLYVGFAEALKEVIIYARCWTDTSDPVARILLDGKDPVANVQAYQPKWLSVDHRDYAVAAFRLRLDEPLEQGTFHTIALVTASGQVFRTQVRAWARPFVIAMMGGPWSLTSDRYFHVLRRHNFNTVMWHHAGRTLQAKHGLWSISGIGPQRPDDPAVLCNYNLDEPDVHDYRVNEIAEDWHKLGAHAHRCLQLRSEMLDGAPRRMDMIVVDATFKPVNYAAYAQASDFPATDPYAPRERPRFGLHSVTARVGALAEHVEPKPMFTLLMCASNPDLFARLPTPAEELLMASYAVGRGPKGIGYYWWHRLDQYHFTGGDALLRGLSDVNGRLKQIGGLAVNAVPTGWAQSSKEKILVESLWAAGDGLVVLVTNEDYTTDPSKDGTTSINPRRNIPVTCRLPDGTEKWRLFRVTPLSWEPVPEDTYTVESVAEGPRIVWTIPDLDVAEWFVINPGPY